MRPILSFLLLFFATFYVFAQDTTPPVLTNITFSPTPAKTGETVTVIVEAHDEMSELFSIRVDLSNPLNQHRVSVHGVVSNWTDLNDNRYSHEFTIYEHDIGGEWYVNSVNILDIANNPFSAFYTPDKSPYKFSVTATDPDTTPPIVDGITFEPSTVEAGNTATLIIDTYDETAGVGFIQIGIVNPKGGQLVLVFDSLVNWTHIDGNRYSHSFTLNEFSLGGKWYVNSVYVTDAVGNSLGKAYGSGSSPYTFNVTATNLDTTPPTLDDITFEPSTVEAGKTFSVIVTAQDDNSGLGQLQVNIANAEDGQLETISAPLTGWTALDNNQYSREHTFNQYALGGEWHVSSVHFTDVAGNAFTKSYVADTSPYKFTVTAINPDTTLPSISDITFDPTSANAGDTVSVIVQAEDDLSGIDYISVRVSNPESSRVIPVSSNLVGWEALEDNRYSRAFILDESAMSGTWFISYLYIRDNANNYFTTGYTSGNPPYTFEVEEALSIENNQQQQVALYPNPSASFVHINTVFSSAKIYDLHGKLQFVFDSKTADVSALANGVYILELFDDKKNKMATFKFIKK